MSQKGCLQHVIDRGYEDYVSVKKNVKAQYGGKLVREEMFQRIQTTPTSLTAVELEEKGGLTISDKASTALTIVLASDTNDNAYDTHSVTGYYITNAGVKKSFTAAYDTDDSTTEVACASDFYCWNLEDYTAATVLVSSVAVQALNNVYIGTTGMVANAELRLATIAAAATYPVVTTLFGAGDVYGKEETNTAGDVGLVITCQYWTPWGNLKEGAFTLAPDTTTIVRLLDTTTGLPVLDFFRRYDLATTALAGKYIVIGFDADKRAGTAALDVFYGVIEEGNYRSIHSRMFAPGSAYGRLFLGYLHICASLATKYAKFHVKFKAKGETAYEELQWVVPGAVDMFLEIACEIEPLSEITMSVSDDAATPVIASILTKSIMVLF